MQQVLGGATPPLLTASAWKQSSGAPSELVC